MRDFIWIEEYQKAFDDLKQYLSSPPLMTKPNIDDELLMYLATTPEAVSSVLVREECRVQKSIYYLSRMLCGAETKYPQIEKVVFTIIITIQRLRPYF